MTRRIWSEFLPAAELAAPATLSVLRRFALQPLIALPPHAESAAMATALRRLHENSIAIGLWPLLEDVDGYWPSVDNAEKFAERVRQVLRFAEAAGVPVRTLAIDLEPPVALKRGLLRAPLHRRARLLLQRYRDTRSVQSQERWRKGGDIYARLATGLRLRGIETLAIAVPPLVLDFAAGTEHLQQLFGTPVVGPAWSTVSPMIYSSMVRDALPRKSQLASRALFAEACRQLSGCQMRSKLCMSLGVVGPGKFGDERSLETPAELARDVAMARAAGIDDMALFSLEGVLGRDHPESWLTSFTRAGASQGADWRADLATLGSRVAGACALALCRRAPPIADSRDGLLQN